MYQVFVLPNFGFYRVTWMFSTFDLTGIISAEINRIIDVLDMSKFIYSPVVHDFTVGIDDIFDP